MIPYRTPFFLPLIYPSLVWRMPAEKKTLYLTFDDGPINGPTDFVLEELNKASAQATFFCIGDNIRKFPDVLKKIYIYGHSIGNHTFHHLNGWKTKTTEYLADIKLFVDQLPEDSPRTSLFRPPYGRITPSQIKALYQYKIIMWDVLTMDYNKDISPESCLQNTIKAIRPGSIIVFHDSFKAEKNMRFALPRVLSHFAEKGYSFRALQS